MKIVFKFFSHENFVIGHTVQCSLKITTVRIVVVAIQFQSSGKSYAISTVWTNKRSNFKLTKKKHFFFLPLSYSCWKQFRASHNLTFTVRQNIFLPHNYNFLTRVFHVKCRRRYSLDAPPRTFSYKEQQRLAVTLKIRVFH